MNTCSLKKPALFVILGITVLYSCSRSENNDGENQSPQTGKCSEGSSAQLDVTLNRINRIEVSSHSGSDEEESKPSKMRKIIKKAGDYNSRLDALSLSKSNLLMRVEDAIQSEDNDRILTLYTILRDSQEFALAFHLSTNALYNASSSIDIAEYAIRTLESFLGAANEDWNDSVIQDAIHKLRHVSKDMNDKQNDYYWTFITRRYCDSCLYVYEDGDRAFDTLQMIDEEIKATENAQKQRELVYYGTAKELLKSTNFKISEANLIHLRKYADSLDDNMIPQCILPAPEHFDIGERRLKRLIYMAIERYEQKNSLIEQ